MDRQSQFYPFNATVAGKHLVHSHLHVVTAPAHLDLKIHPRTPSIQKRSLVAPPPQTRDHLPHALLIYATALPGSIATTHAASRDGSKQLGLLDVQPPAHAHLVMPNLTRCGS